MLQTGKTPPMPLVLMELPKEDYWESWDQFIRTQLLSRELISPDDLSLYKIAHSASEAVDWITEFYSTYHSMRQVRDTLVLRLEKELTDDHVDELNRIFKDLVRRGSIRKVEPHAVESDEPDLLSKPRIAFSYNDKSAGRLTDMILAINQMGEEVLDPTG